MIVLATGETKFDIQGERIIMTVPSGKDKLQIALSLSDLMVLDHRAHLAVVAFYRDQHTPKSEGELVAFPRTVGRR